MKTKGFVNFVRKRDGKKEIPDVTDYISAEKRLGFRLSERYGGLLEYLSGRTNFASFNTWYAYSIGDTERQVVQACRRDIGFSFWASYSVGVHNRDGSAIRKAVECILRHHPREQQDDVPANTPREPVRVSSENIDEWIDRAGEYLLSTQYLSFPSRRYTSPEPTPYIPVSTTSNTPLSGS
jgi:hypothetical protein